MRAQSSMTLAVAGAVALAFFCALLAGPTRPAAQSGVLTASDLAAYLTDHEGELRKKLTQYNRRHRIVVSAGGSNWNIAELEWEVLSVDEDLSLVAITFGVGRTGWDMASGGATFELAWAGRELALLGHRALPKRRSNASGWISYGAGRCIHNYYAPNPCIGVIRAWIDFADLHGLALGPESAKIYQAYKQNSLAIGDRLLARARGLPEPGGESVFDLQAAFNRLDLGRYQRNAETGCDLNPYGPKPCPEILEHFQTFAEKHGLPLSPDTATMFEAYAQGNFQKADVIYALAKGFAVPAYGYIPTGPAREVAALRMRLDQISGTRKEPCSHNPYVPAGARYKPCAEVLKLWRDFAARYQLADNAESARIFARYAEGEFRDGDQLLASAKGVSLEQLLDAAGVPREGLVIEVYPGWRRAGQRSRVGS